eukprot:15432565-Alexandrium_andersonii.AAC.1
MRNGVRRSKLDLRGSRKRRRRQQHRFGSKLHPTGLRPGGSASFRALSPMVTTKRAGGSPGGAIRG